MVILHKITWLEFEKIIQILKNYKPKKIEINKGDESWFNEILFIFSKVKKQPYNIEIEDLKKEDLSRITAIVDMQNVIKNPIKTKINYNYEYDKISSKLQRAYFKIFNESIFPKD
jgi:hypothetical protein